MEVKSPTEDVYVIVFIPNYLLIILSYVIGTGPQCTVNIVNNTGDDMPSTTTNLSHEIEYEEITTETPDNY